MLWLAAALWLVGVCIVVALLVAAVDEYRRPASNVRRAGALLALVASFASLWLLLRPPTTPAGCPAPVMVLAEVATPAGCAPGWSNTIAGIAAAVVAVGAVLATRNRT
jgi:hypothetical protein